MLFRTARFQRAHERTGGLAVQRTMTRHWSGAPPAKDPARKSEMRFRGQRKPVDSQGMAATATSPTISAPR